jgi:hypothetical protein
VTIPRIAAKRFNVGKYIVVAEPIPHSAHMLRYTVFVGRNRIGSLASMPSEADCLYLEKPPVVPPLKIYHVTNRPGRPKKGSKPPMQQQESKGYTPAPLQDLPAGINIPRATSE